MEVFRTKAMTAGPGVGATTGTGEIFSPRPGLGMPEPALSDTADKSAKVKKAKPPPKRAGKSTKNFHPPKEDGTPAIFPSHEFAKSLTGWPIDVGAGHSSNQELRLMSHSNGYYFLSGTESGDECLWAIPLIVESPKIMGWLPVLTAPFREEGGTDDDADVIMRDINRNEIAIFRSESSTFRTNMLSFLMARFFTEKSTALELLSAYWDDTTGFDYALSLEAQIAVIELEAEMLL